MAEHQNQPFRGHQQLNPRIHQMIKAVTAVTAGGSLLVLSGLILAGTVVSLALATPLLVIFSPVLVPATVMVGLLMMGFLTSGGFGVAALSVLSWIYRYATGKQPMGADRVDEATAKLGSIAREMKEKGEHYAHQVTGTQSS